MIKKKVRNFFTKAKIAFNFGLRKITPIKNVYDVDQSIDLLIKSNLSLSRFGDGEFELLFGKSKIGFQTNTNELRKKLELTLKNKNPNLLVGIPHNIIYMDDLVPNSKSYWRYFYGMHYRKLINYLNRKDYYVDAGVTRLYMGYIDKNNPKISERFEKLRSLWSQKDVIIVEGAESKLGMLNDYFQNTKSIKRIICPSQNAFEKYDEILKTIEVNRLNNEVVLLALGPTATVLAYDLANKGIRALDIGHIDVEYEWYKMKAVEKIALKGRHLNEAKQNQDSSFSTVDYLASIVARVE